MRLKQTKLERFFPVERGRKNVPVTFCDLPAIVRRRVYELAGLSALTQDRESGAKHYEAKSPAISLNYRARKTLGYYDIEDDTSDSLNSPEICRRVTTRDFHCWEKTRGDYDDGDSSWRNNDQFPSQLLFVSKLIHQDVLSMIYSENCFTVVVGRWGGLEVLERLGTNTLRHLRHLSIELLSCGCESSTCIAWTTRDNSCKHPSGRMTPGCFECYLSTLRRIFQTIAPQLDVTRLSLHLELDTTRHDIASKVLKTLGVFRGSLKHCAIWTPVSDAPDMKMRQLVMATTESLVRPRQLGSCFEPFTRLPYEIQCRILMFSLVWPSNVTWFPQHGFQPVSCCDTCFPGKRTLQCCCGNWKWASWSTMCRCRRIPLALFLVNHKIREMALNLFFLTNRFELIHSREDDDDPERDLAGFFKPAALVYYRKIRYLKLKLDLVHGCIENRDSDLSRFNSIAIQPLQRVVAGVAKFMNVEDLTLVLDLTEPLIKHKRHCYSRTSCAILRGTEDYQMQRTLYEKLINECFVTNPLLRPEGKILQRMPFEPCGDSMSRLRDLYIYIAWPMYRIEERRSCERLLEQLVLGPAYDSVLRGKPMSQLTDFEIRHDLQTMQ